MREIAFPAGLAIAIGAFAAMALGTDINGPAAPARDTIAAVSGDKRVTMAMYRQLRDGMSYWGATEMLGREGEEVARNRLESIPGVMSEVVTVAYSWQNWDGSNIQLMFQNDRLVLKAQAGLR